MHCYKPKLNNFRKYLQNLSMPNHSSQLVTQPQIQSSDLHELQKPITDDPQTHCIPKSHDLQQSQHAQHQRPSLRPGATTAPQTYPAPPTECYLPFQRDPQAAAKLKSLVCEYITHLIEENEQLTQISRAYTVPTPLDFENEHYFEEVRNTDHHFPSERFRAWLEMKEHGQSMDSYLPPCVDQGYIAKVHQLPLKVKTENPSSHDDS